MSYEIIAQGLDDTEIVHEIPCLQAFAGAGIAKVSSAEPGVYCASYRIKIRGCRPGCFL
jgi:hypothetical protein